MPQIVMKEIEIHSHDRTGRKLDDDYFQTYHAHSYVYIRHNFLRSEPIQGFENVFVFCIVS